MIGLKRWLIVAWIAVAAGSGPAGAQTVSSPWIDHERARSRLVAAEADGGLVAFIEIEMPPGWKTYWRNPGDAGGLPPSFDFSKSENVTKATVLYPAPKRLTDAAGQTIGYKEHATFPVKIDVAAKDKPVGLKAAAHFGVCKEICVPLEASYELAVPPGAVGPAEGVLREALQHVPRPPDEAAAGDPKLVAAKVDSSGETPRLTFEAAFPAGSEGADVFIEAPDGLYVPMPKRAAGAADGATIVFETAIASQAELKPLLGKPLKVTLVSDAGQSETTVTLTP